MTKYAVIQAENQSAEFLRDVLRGLSQATKQIPSKYFYDARGSQLFDAICDLPEYYPTRTEIEILRAHRGAMARELGAQIQLIELGSGSSLKTRLLLDVLSIRCYVAVDISRAHLEAAAARLQSDYPNLCIKPLCADYTRELDLPDSDGARRVAFFPGSTIGNFTPQQAAEFLQRLAPACDALLIGVDLKKDAQVLNAAYNDARGVTAQFNLNLLARINAELGGDFALENWAHFAWYNPTAGRIEMHLQSQENQLVRIGERAFGFAPGETITTEYSYKYDVEEFADLATRAGFALQTVWTDARRWFAVMLFVTKKYT